MKAEDAKCARTHDKEPCDLKSILKQQQGEKENCRNAKWPGSAEITGAKHLQCISVISLKATVLEFMHQESKTKTTKFSLCQPKGNESGNSRGRQTKEGWKYFLKKCTYINRVIELLKAVHSEEMGHSHAVVNQQFDKTDSIHHQGIQQGLLQGPNLFVAYVYYE